MMTARLLQDKGSLSVIRRSLVPFGSPESCQQGLFDGESYLCVTPLLILTSATKEPTPTSLISTTMYCWAKVVDAKQ